MKKMLITRYKSGLTLVELLVALVVTSTVSAAITTLAFALGSANDASGDTCQKQAQIRSATIRIQELIRHSRLICSVNADDIAIWSADKNNDGQINIGELVYIDRGSNRDYLNICSFNSSDNSIIELSSIVSISTNWWSIYCNDNECIQVIPQCSNVQFNIDVSPPQSRFISISFDIVENDISHQYQIDAVLRGRAGNLLDIDGGITSDDD